MGPLGAAKTITRVHLLWAADVPYLTNDTFPNLRFLTIPYHCSSLIMSLKNVEEIRCCGIDEPMFENGTGRDLGRINKANYPKLKRGVRAVDGRDQAVAWAGGSLAFDILHMLRIKAWLELIDE